MTTPSTLPPAPVSPRRKSSWGRKLLIIAGVFLLLLVVAYFVVTSSGFFKGVILPQASKAVGADITVSEAAISPFSHVGLRQLTVKTTGTEPLLTAEAMTLRYSLTAILGGTIKVDEVTIESPVIQIVENADGTSNLDPLFKTKPETKSAPSSSTAKTPLVDLKNFALKNATVRMTKNLKGGGQEVTEVSGVNITLDQLKNGQASKLSLAAALKVQCAANDVLEAKTTGDISFTLGADLMPQALKANIEESISRAEGSFQPLAGGRGVIAGDVIPTEIKELSMRFLRGEQLLGEVKVSGPLDMAKKEGHLKLEIASIDKQVLNLIGAPMGIDFGGTVLNATTDLTLSQGGTAVLADLRFAANKFSVTQKGQTTPPVDVQVAVKVAVNTAAESAEVQVFTLDGAQNGKALLHGSLAKPMTVAWGAKAAAVPDSTFDLVVTDFDFAQWKPVLGEAISAGRLSAQLNVISEQGGKQLKLSVKSQMADVTAKLGATPLSQVAMNLKLDAQVNDFKKFNLSDYRLELTQQAQPALTVSGSASYDGAAFTLQSQIAAVAARLTGSGPTTPLDVGLKLNGAFANQVLDLKQLNLTLTPTTRAAKNELNVTGHIDLTTPGMTKGNVAVKADTLDLTQLYDLFSGNTNAAAKPVASTPAPAPKSQTEPEPMTLPAQVTAEVNIGQVYLHDIEMKAVQMTAKVDDSKVTVDPCKLTLNGAPVTATVDVNLGVKGYTYAVNAQMDKVPLEPIADTFSPATRGQYKGLIVLDAQIKGAGITGTSLQKNLTGKADFSFTNANIQLSGPKLSRLLVPIARLLNVSEVMQSPLDWVQAQTVMGGGNIKVSQLTVQSAAFEATSTGVIPIADVLNDSKMNLPVNFALRRSLAENASLLAANTPTNAVYAPLPQFVTVVGTLGTPDVSLKKLALGGVVLQSAVGTAEKLGLKVTPNTSNLLNGIGGLLTGQRPAANTNTNQPTTNAPAKVNLLDLFQKK